MRVSQLTKPEILSARDAVDRIPDRARLLIEASGGGVIEPSGLLHALADRYRATATPSELSAYFCSGIGDRAGAGMDILAIPGLIRSAVAGHWAMTPTLSKMAHDGEIEGYNLPQGVLAQLLRGKCGQTARACHQSWSRHVLRPAPGWRQAQRRYHGRPGRTPGVTWGGVPLLSQPRIRCRVHPRHYRRRTRQPHARTRDRQTRCPGGRDGRAQQRWNRDCTSQAPRGPAHPQPEERGGSGAPG